MAEASTDSANSPRDENERLHLAIRLAEIGTWDWDIRSGAVSFDDVALAMLGGEPGDDQGHHESVFLNIHPDDRERAETEIRSAIDGQSEFDMEYRVLWPDESLHVIHSKGKVFFEGAGAVRMMGVLRTGISTGTSDISSVVESEAKLQVSLYKLEQVNKELKEFAYVASHDLREPLRTVRSYCELLEEKYRSQFDEDADLWMGFIMDATSHMQDLISDLLTYSRLQTRTQPIESIDCNDLVREVLQLLDSAIQEASAEITIGELPALMGEASQMRQLFQNLIANALKYRADRPCQIGVSAKRMGESWEFCIEDNGIGIKPEFFEKIFVVFKRLHPRDKYSGTGIGLAICRRIVLRHGGRIWLESEVGQGTRFYFTIPQEMFQP